MSRWPAVVVSINREKRQPVVSIPGITDGSDGLLAEIEQNIGDRSEHTEIRILAGDRVWVDFLGGDKRYPIITGFRAKNVENIVGTRHWEHERFTVDADESVTITAGQTIRLQAGALIELVVGGSTITITPEQIAQVAAALAITAPTTINGAITTTGGMTIDGIVFGGHSHMEQGDGAPVGPPIQG